MFKDRKPEYNLIYKTASGVNLPIQVFLPDGDIYQARTVLCIHGGGWNSCAICDNSPWDGGWMGNNARYFAEKGFIGIAISYRCLTLSDELNVGDLLEDCRDAVRYIREHFDFVDFDDIIYAGDSAGGYLVTMLGLSQDDYIRPHTVISLNPVLEVPGDKWGYGFNNCVDIDSLVPKKNVGQKCAQFIFLHGTADSVVEIEYTQEFHNMLSDNGHQSEFVEIPEAMHAFVLYDYKYPDEYVTDIMELIVQKINEKSNI